MNKQLRRGLLFFVILIAIVASGCAGSLVQPSEPETYQTQVPLPTYTPLPTLTPVPTQTPVPPTDTPAVAPQANNSSLNYDESNGDALSSGQSQLIAEYLRIPAPISQAQLETAVGAIQIEADRVGAERHEGSTLTLNQHVAWLVWCSDATLVDPPADFSLPIEESFLSAETLGRVYIQVPFDLNVPPRTDANWIGCESFWAVQVH